MAAVVPLHLLRSSVPQQDEVEGGPSLAVPGEQITGPEGGRGGRRRRRRRPRLAQPRPSPAPDAVGSDGSGILLGGEAGNVAVHVGGSGGAYSSSVPVFGEAALQRRQQREEEAAEAVPVLRQDPAMQLGGSSGGHLGRCWAGRALGTEEEGPMPELAALELTGARTPPLFLRRDLIMAGIAGDGDVGEWGSGGVGRGGKGGGPPLSLSLSLSSLSSLSLSLSLSPGKVGKKGLGGREGSSLFFFFPPFRFLSAVIIRGVCVGNCYYLIAGIRKTVVGTHSNVTDPGWILFFGAAGREREERA